MKGKDIRTITLKQVITNHQYNDLAFVVRDIMMVFVEAQSSWSANVAVRILLYLADTIQEYIHENHMDIHGTRKLRLPEMETIRICKDRGVLKEYLESREKEVVSIMIMLFDQEYATEAYVRSQKEEGRKEGERQGILSTLLALVKNGLLKKEDAAAQAGLTVAEFEEESCRLSSL